CDRSQREAPGTRVHVGRPGDDAGGAAVARVDSRTEMGSPVPPQCGPALEGIGICLGTSVCPVDAGTVRSAINAGGCGTRIRRKRLSGDRRSSLARAAGVEQLVSAIGQTIEATALHDRVYANWPQSIGVPRPGRTALLVQHCHGAPGIVNCLADFPDSGIDDLLTAAGELTWAAGPLRKGPNLCHGTAGHRFAVLQLFPRAPRSPWPRRSP